MEDQERGGRRVRRGGTFHQDALGNRLYCNWRFAGLTRVQRQVPHSSPYFPELVGYVRRLRSGPAKLRSCL
jgi:hypothetical protein